MDKKTRSLTLTALFAAIAVALLYFAALLPTARLGITALAGLLTAAAVLENGIWSGLALYVCSAALAFILLPMKSAAIIYTAFFGIYPVLKSLIERTDGRVLAWALKLIIFNAALTVLFFLWRAGFLAGLNLGRWALFLIYLGGNFCFVLYDIAFSMLVQGYLKRFHNKR